MNWDRLEWKWRLFKRRLAEALQGFVPRRRGEAARLKTCHECRALVSRTARTCPECGVRLGWFVSPRASGAGMGGFFAQSPGTAGLLMAMLGLFLATWVGSGLRPTGLSNRVLLRFGAYHSYIFQTGEYWRLLTGVFLHGGLTHILFNSAALYFLGREVESIYGWARTLVLFLGAGVAGSLASVVYHAPPMVGIGASGGIFGLIGVVGVFGYRRGGGYGRQVIQLAGQWAVLSFVYGFLAGADNAAHLGGLLGGAALAFLVPPERERISPLWNAAGILAAALVPLAFFFAFRNVV